MKMTNDEYKKYSERHAPRSPVGPHMLWAFVVGGLICCFGQFLLNLYGAAGLDKEAATTATSVSLVFLGALFTGLGLYDKLAEKPGPVRWCPSPAFPTPWRLRLWNSRPRALSPARRRKCSSLPGL